MRAVFFDRDDTIIVNVPYNGDPAKVKLLPHARECLQKLGEAGFELFIVSNQSGVGRGMITKDDVRRVNEEMERQLGEKFFKKIYNCYAAPEDPYSECRKPSPAMLFEARDEFNLDLSASFIVGDKLSDVECGRNAGCRTVLVLTGEGKENLRTAKADLVAKDLTEVANWIVDGPGVSL